MATTLKTVGGFTLTRYGAGGGKVRKLITRTGQPNVLGNALNNLTEDEIRELHELTAPAIIAEYGPGGEVIVHDTPDPVATYTAEEKEGA